MQIKYSISAFAILCATLTGCGDTVPEQALIGAGAGVGAAAVVDGSLGTGAVVGAAGNVAFCQLNPGKC